MKKVVIFKYPLNPRGLTSLVMPVFAKVIAVQNQREEIVVWVEIPSQSGEKTGATGNRTFYSVLTGHHTELPKKAEYVGTVQLNDGAYVAHVYQGDR